MKTLQKRRGSKNRKDIENMYKEVEKKIETNRSYKERKQAEKSKKDLEISEKNED